MGKSSFNYSMPMYSGFSYPPYSSGFTPAIAGSSNNKNNESFEQYEKRINGEISNFFTTQQKKDVEYQTSLSTESGSQLSKSNNPLSESEREGLKKTILENEAKNNEKHSGGIGSTLAGTGIFGGIMAAPHIKTSDRVIDMFYKENSNAIKLFKSHPDLMIDAQKAMRKLDNAYTKDIKRAKGNKDIIDRICQERKAMNEAMKKAITDSNTDEIAKLTAKAEFGNKSINGRISRFKRVLKGKNQIRSREAAVKLAETNGKIKTKTVKEGTSFLRNLGGKSAFLNAGMFMLLPMIMDYSKIKSAYDIDKETGNKQLMQSGTKAGLSAVAFMGGDAIGKTIIKKCMGKIAGKVATKIATKGTGKLLGTAIGSIVPGAGTIVGLIVGTAADFAIEKFLLPKMFENDAVTVKTVSNMKDEELLGKIQEQYTQGNDIGKNGLAILERKYNKETLDELKRVHNMTDSERAKYMETMQQQMQALQAAQTQGLNQTV